MTQENNKKNAAVIEKLWWRFFYFGEVTFISLLLPVSELFHGLMTLLLMRKKKVQGNADTSIPSP